MKSFTLIEILLSLLIICLIVIMMIFFTINIANFNTYFVFNLGKQREVILTATIMSKELRSMSQSNIGNYPIEKAQNNEIIFYSNIDNDNLIERIRYFVESNSFKKGIIKPQGNPLNYSQSNEIFYLMISELYDSNIFQYFNKNNQLTSEIINIKLIKVNLSTKDNKNNPFYYSFLVAPRNLRFK
ncbi:MAG: hypothetical protein NZ866_01345 [Patescibacteria group bacterium]|nr:hypothetical protein [Patescibacteria group bacterium]